MSKKQRTWKLAVSGVLALTVIAAGVFTYRYESASYKEQMDELEEQQTAEAEEKEKQEEENAAQENAAEEEPETADASTDSVDAVTGDETAAEQQPDLTEETLPETEEPEAADASAQRSILPELNFSEETVLQAPVNGQVLIDYSMDSTVYFPTLNVYKYNPAVIISAAEGEQVLSAANGRVTSITQDEETGRTVTMDLGNGYEVIYGQLQEVNLEEGAYVYQGASVGTIGTPTKYYSQEGTNLYFQMKKDGESIDPMLYLNGAEE